MSEQIETLVATITARLQDGVAPWRKPWTHGGVPWEPRRADGQPFSGFNAWTLAMIAALQGFDHATWLTYKQAEALGGQVRRGERASPAVLYKAKAVGGAKDGDEPASKIDSDGRVIRFLRTYSTFNVAQIDGLPEQYYADARPERRDPGVLPPELAAVPVRIEYDGSNPAYYPSLDLVRMPFPGDFESPAHHVACRVHETLHWTAGPGRIERGLDRYHLDDGARALEELTVELGTILLSMRLGLPMSPSLMDNHTAYIASWARLLADTPSALMKASGQAQKAVDHLLSYSQDARSAPVAEAA